MNYTVHELERMRVAIREIHNYRSQFDMVYDDPDIERELLTYMANGTAADELEERKDELEKKSIYAMHWHEAIREDVQRYCKHKFKNGWCELCCMKDKRSKKDRRGQAKA